MLTQFLQIIKKTIDIIYMINLKYIITLNSKILSEIIKLTIKN